MSHRPAILERASVVTDFTRCRLLATLDGRELSVGELCSVLQLPQSTVSRHLRVLTESDWVISRREGTSHYYRRQEPNGDQGESLWSLLHGEIEDDPVLRSDQERLEQVLRERRLRGQEFFSSTAGEWDRLRDEMFGSRSDLLSLLALLDPDLVVGDLGCGTGRVASALASFVQRVEAVDDSPGMLSAAAERLRGLENVQLRQGELEALPLDDGSLDLAIMVLSLHHALQPRVVLSEVRRVLRPGGRFLLVEVMPHDREEYRQRMGHQFLGFEPAELAAIVQSAGFATCRTVQLPPDPDATGPGLFTLTSIRPAAEE